MVTVPNLAGRLQQVGDASVLTGHRMDAHQSTRAGWIAGLAAASMLLVACGSDSDNGSPAAGFSGDLSGTVAEDGSLTATGRVTAAWLDDDGDRTTLDKQPQTPSDRGYGSFKVSGGSW